MANPPRRGLLDQYGETIPPEDIARLREETSPAGAIHSRPPFQGHLAWGIDPQRLGAIVRAADAGNSLDWMILAEEIEELFPHYAAVLAKRKRQVAQLPITVTAADDDVPAYVEHAEFVRDWIQTGAMQHALFNVLDAIGKGYSVHEIVWEQRPGRAWPKMLLYRPQRFFELCPLDGQTVRLRTEAGFQELTPHKFLLHTHPSKSGGIMRSGITRMVAFLWAYATFNMKDWALFTQAYGLPVRLGRYGPEASDGDKKTLWRAVSSIAGDVAAIIPKSMEMEFVTQADRGAGASLYERRGDWLNREVSKLVLGGTAGTEAINGGHAVGQEHRAAEADVERYDAGLLNVTFNQQIIPAMIAFTFGPQDEYPLAAIGRPDELPVKDLVEAVANLGSMGLKVKGSEIRNRLNLTRPEDDEDDVVGGPPVPIEKPKIPSPVRRMPESGFSARGGWLGTITSRMTQESDDVLDSLTARLAEDAAGALGGMTDIIRAEFDAATDMRDLVTRLHALKLPSKDFAEAMARGMAVAELAGQASLIEELRGKR